MTVKDIPAVDRLLKKEFVAHQAPIIELIEAQTHDPFCVLVGTILSARTKDACTTGAVRRLFAEKAGEVFAPADLERLTVKKIEKLIFPVGFFRDKARHLKELPKVLREKFGGVLPKTVEELCELPGVGRKTANLTVAVGFDLPAICVDVHMHSASRDTSRQVLEDMELAPRVLWADALRATSPEVRKLSHQPLLLSYRVYISWCRKTELSAVAR